jgi:phosphatidate cytidylyltransferase
LPPIANVSGVLATFHPKKPKNLMPDSSDLSLRRRLIVIDILLPIGLVLVFLGGWAFFAAITAVLLIAGWELWRMFKQGGYAPSLAVILLAIAGFTLTRQLWGFDYSHLVISAVILISMAVHVIEQQHGATTSAVDFMVTLGASLYLGWIGSYAISIRALPVGLYWTLLAFSAVALADTGGYIFGRLFGKHKIADIVSPKKTWEGYAGGILMSVLITWGLAALGHFVTPEIVASDGLWMGLVMAVFTPGGDFGESMIKRQFNIKDSSHLLPGHGGIFDRIDSWLWAAVLGYALILLLR